MNTNYEKHKNNPLSDDKSEMLSFNSLLNDKLSKELNANEEGDDYPLEVHEDEKLYSFYYNITENLSEYPIDFTTSDLTTRLYKKLCRALSSAMLDSVLILGEEGNGKSSLLHYFAQEVNKENCTDLLKGAQVIGFSPKSFSESSTEIALVISNVLHKLANENQKKVIIFLDEFDRYSTTFWYEYPTILDLVISEFEDFELIKFVLTVESNTFYILEDDLKSSVVKSSVMMNITQEVLPEKIISTLNPRIEELKKVHGVKSICYEALEMIYTMSTVEIEMFFASYKRFLINLDNVLCWCELEGVNFLDCETVLNYYKENEKEIESEDSSEFFNNNYNKEDTALHETGHSVIALLNQDFIYLSGVSIFKIRTPSGDTGDGVTITNIDDRVWWMNRDNYVKYLAFYLAGKYAQKNLDSGNYDDLNVANYYAKKFVCSSGLSNPVGINVYYDADEYKNFSEHNKNIIDREVRELIKDATNYAKMAISNNKEFIAKMVSALLKKNFLSRNEILKLWALYGNNQIE